MADTTAVADRSAGADRTVATGPTTRSSVVRRRGPATYLLRLVAVAYLFFLVAWPLYLVGQNTFED
nr:hypothetical protein [Micromonospora sp. DSM 115978]